MATRSVTIEFNNNTPFTLTKVEDHLDHGIFTEPNFPPPTILPGVTVMWESESDGDIPLFGSIGTGTEGHVKYRVDRDDGSSDPDTLFLHWNNPFIASDLGRSGDIEFDGFVSHGFTGAKSDEIWIARDPMTTGTTGSIFNFSGQSDARGVFFLNFQRRAVPPPPPQPPPSAGVRGNSYSGSFIQSRFGTQGNFELSVPQGDRMRHYFRDNDAPGLPWHKGAELSLHVGGVSPMAATVATGFTGVALIQSNFGTPGNFEVVARTSPIVEPGGEDDSLVFFFFDSSALRWNGPFSLHADGKAITGVSGSPALIQSTFGNQGNFELLVPQGDRVGHYFRDNDAPGVPWHKGAELGLPAGGVSPTAATVATSFTGVALIQSNFGTPSNFEVVARTSPIVEPGGEGDSLVFFFFDSSVLRWNGPFPLHADGKAITGVSGSPALIQSTFGKQGNFELLVPQGDRLGHYFRDNDAPGMPWHKGAELSLPAGGVSPTAATTARHFTEVALIQSNCGTPGNFEVVTRTSPIVNAGGAGDLFVFFFFDSSVLQWNGPFHIVADGSQISG